MRVFDYAFYSLYNLYLVKEGRNSNPILSSSLAIAALHISLLFGIAILSLLFTDQKIHEFFNITKNSFIILSCVIVLIWQRQNYISYKKRLPEIVKKYKNHPRNKWFRPWMLYFVALGFVLIPILIVKLLKVFS